MKKEKLFEWNPSHQCGTCAFCGGEMAYNVPRLGPNGGFIHRDTGDFLCKPKTSIRRKKNEKTLHKETN